MTRTARLLGLKKSKFANPHGLACMRNKASAKNLGKIAVSLLKHSVASRIVSTQEYTCKITNMNKTRYATWNNTNILLDSNEVTGVKTGNTPTAGPCLVSSFKLNGFHLVVTILGCRTPERRWGEARRLAYWAEAQLLHCSKGYRRSERSFFNPNN